MNAPTWPRRVNSRSFAGGEEIRGEVYGVDRSLARGFVEQGGVMIDSVLELLEAALVELLEGEEELAGAGVGHEGDDESLELLGALAGLEGVEVTSWSPRAAVWAAGGVWFVGHRSRHC